MRLAHHSRPPGPPDPPDLHNILGDKKILIVDDEADIRRLISMMLSKKGVDSVCVTSADDAMEVLTRDADDIGLVLLDLSVPNSTDTPPLERIKAEYPEIPTIVITGLTEADVNIDSAYADSVGYLRKPFLPSALYEALGKRRAGRDSGSRTRRTGKKKLQ